MNIRNQLICIHATGLFLVLVGGFFLVAGWVPPPSPSMPRAEVLEMFRDDTNVRVGAAMLFFGGAFFAVPCMAYTTQMRRIEGPNYTLANVQLAAAAVGVLGLMIPAALWLAISYRDDNPAAIVVTLNDVAWFMLLSGVGAAVVQNLSIGLAILGGDGRIYPRWVGYANFWVATGLLPGIAIPFFKNGPLGWNGILGFGVVGTAFFAWVLVMWIWTVKAIRVPDETQNAAT